MGIHAPMDIFHRSPLFCRTFHLISSKLQLPRHRKGFFLFRCWTRNIYMDYCPARMSKRVVKR